MWLTQINSSWLGRVATQNPLGYAILCRSEFIREWVYQAIHLHRLNDLSRMNSLLQGIAVGQVDSIQTNEAKRPVRAPRR